DLALLRRLVAIWTAFVEERRKAATEVVERVALGRTLADVFGDEVVEQRLTQRMTERRELLAHAAGDAQEIAALVDRQPLGAAQAGKRGELRVDHLARRAAREHERLVHPALDRCQLRRACTHEGVLMRSPARRCP